MAGKDVYIFFNYASKKVFQIAEGMDALIAKVPTGCFCKGAPKIG